MASPRTAISASSHGRCGNRDNKADCVQRMTSSHLETRKTDQNLGGCARQTAAVVATAAIEAEVSQAFRIGTQRDAIVTASGGQGKTRRNSASTLSPRLFAFDLPGQPLS